MLIFFKLLLLSLVSFATTDLRVLFFTMDACPPCKQTEPGIDQLRNDGVAVSKIDVRQHQDYARQCQVTRTPTVLVVDGNQVLARHTGALAYADLRRMVQQAQPPQEPAVEQPVATQASQPVSHAASAPARTDAASGGLSPQQRAKMATVRFRVEDSEGVSYATGTIIHRQGDEALVLTCGHVFRDSQGQGKIHSDIGFTFGQPQTVTGKLLFYNAEEHDIALVAIPCPLPIEPVSVAPEMMAVQTGDKIFSIGCDRGAPPSIRQSVLKAVTTYSGVPKYDIVGRPVDGRSGGGLFSAGGQLIGVCNAAAVEVDEGIYAGLQSVYWQFAKTNLTHLLTPTTGPNSLESQPPPAQVAVRQHQQPQQTQQTPATSQSESYGGLEHPAQRTPANNVVARNDELKPPASRPVFRGNQVPVNNAVFRGNEVPVRNAGHTNTDELEMIVILRSRNDAQATETITIHNPDRGMLEMLRSRSQPERAKMARLPDLQRPSDRYDSQQIRAQSPR